MTFSLRLAAHALLNPVVFTDEADLRAMSDAIRAAGEVARRMGNDAQADRYAARADYLLTLV